MNYPSAILAKILIVLLASILQSCTHTDESVSEEIHIMSYNIKFDDRITLTGTDWSGQN